MSDIDFKYGEDDIIAELYKYISATYNEHYMGNNDVQAVDVWEANGSLSTTAKDNSIKYLMRYGKKKGKNRLDILKTMHYCVLMLYADRDVERSILGDANE
tara:strand:- start:2556 stop:2858 length:303 start_codon:yes stop_codon:yes gene_type:complete